MENIVEAQQIFLSKTLAGKIILNISKEQAWRMAKLKNYVIAYWKTVMAASLN